MIVLYRDDKECKCAPDQVAQMEDAGWSRTKEAPKPKVVEKPKVVSKKDD